MSQHAGTRAVSALLLLIVGTLALATGWTAMNYRGGSAEEADLDDREHASGTVQECEKVGPVSLSGVGYWWKCTVEVNPEKGDPYTQVFNGSHFENDEVGQTFPLASAGQNSSTWSRSDIGGNNWATMVTALGLIIGVACLGVGIKRVFTG
ncbi:MAG TPA: hypothetical protein H9902_12790 [Candidatus Stackebrandtia faecavium]|nr:hypothetical protein [Candidatus Stackebrandtia faecavium]